MPHDSWGNLKVEYAPVFKLLVCLQEPLEADLAINGAVTLPATQRPCKQAGLYALALSRYNKVVLSNSFEQLELVRGAICNRPDLLVGDASSAITTARISGDYCAELMSRSVDVDVKAMEDGAYVRCQLDQTPIVIHRDGQSFWIHWPEALTDYFAQWIGSVVSLKRT